MTLAAVLAACALSGCGGSSKSGGGKTGSDGAKLVTIWSPTDEPAIEEWWVEKINAFNEEHKTLSRTFPVHRERLLLFPSTGNTYVEDLA